MPKFTKGEDDLDDFADKWIYFIKEAGRLNYIPQGLSIEPFKHAFNIAAIAGLSKEELDAVEATSMSVQNKRGMIEAALEKGLSEGRMNAKTEDAKAMLAEGNAIELVVKITGLSKKEVDNWK